ncbi:serine hydrolase [Muricauda sp. MAR_2010_75]|uniref:serine hydrolase n=1 Tax=Allomuricauda sp. MAR_2010_75 TaxID=1250232 RepID=UPI00055B91BC|nr:serine hydrolase [Muricauda sp. MAR_2010_75]
MNSRVIGQTCLLALTILLHLSMYSQMSSTKVDELANKALETFGVAGASVGIVKDGKIVHLKGYGVKSVDTKLPITGTTPFAIASLGKAFTTTALAILVEEGKISWNDKVIKYIPEFKMYDSYVTENFTIKDLLTHRSGLGMGVGDLMGYPSGSNFTIEDVLESFQYFEPKSPFRTQFDYDNLLYWVAGEVIARVTDSSWERFVEKSIFEPLQLENTYSRLDNVKDLNQVAVPHISASNGIRTIAHFRENVNGAAGGIFSSAEDMCKWMLVHLNNGKYGKDLQKQLFSSESQYEMWKIHTVMDASNDPRYNSHFLGYGLGWFVSDVRGNLSLVHTGGGPGIMTKIWLLPEMNLGIVILTNTSESGGAFFSSVSKTIADSYLGLDSKDWVSVYQQRFQHRQQQGDSITTAVWKIIDANKSLPINFDDYIGTYEDRWFGKIEIHKNNGQLWFKSYRSPKLTGSMYHYKANTFAIKWEDRDLQADAFASFVLNEEGLATEIRMKGISPNIDFSYDFQDLLLYRVLD